MNTTTQTFPRTSRPSGTEYAAAIEHTRRSNREALAIVAGVIAATLIVYVWLWWQI